jgi:formate hydrogenlyase subunit 3/multisubunit Na+/H+ antiporter MnhD subunit
MSETPISAVGPAAGSAQRKRSTARRLGGAIVGAIFGLIFGVGVGLYLSQTGTLDMNSASSLVAPIGGVVLGVLAGWFGGRVRKI